MKTATTRHTALCPILLALTVIGLAGAAQAGEMPKRKAGLWEINLHMQGAPSMGPMQQCIDRNTDNIMQQKAKNNKQECSVMDVSTSGGKVTVHSVCKVDGSTATSDGFFEGSFDSNYRGALKTRFNPPLHGMSESNLTQEARWLGPCKPGQKPGDVIMPSMGGMNLGEMMKDPKMQEMMRRQQGR